MGFKEQLLNIYQYLFSLQHNVAFLQSPPAIVKLVMESICIMMSMKSERKPDPSTGKMFEDFWGPSVKLLSDLKFLDRLKGYDKENIPPAIMKKIRST